MVRRFLITGGAGFIGSALIRYLIRNTDHYVLNIDKLTYAGNLDSLTSVSNHPRYSFQRLDICDEDRISNTLTSYCPDIIMHLAAESHVDRSIVSPKAFIETNIMGTYILLEQCRKYWEGLDKRKQEGFRFHHISTDEVYGDLEETDDIFTELTPYNPSSPYSASKASSDHLVRAWQRTFKLPTIITNCSNNYGPYQFPEKLIPLMILNALQGNQLPIYGEGNQIRDWLYVKDHVRALIKVALEGRVGETYNIGGDSERRNLEVVYKICEELEELFPIINRDIDVESYRELIKFVPDRPGHDRRYAIDASKIKNDLGWIPQETFESGIRKTIQWYLENLDWCRRIQDKRYQEDN